MKILIKDNYFDNPDYVREIGLHHVNYREDNEIGYGVGGWRGKRSLPIRLENSPCPCCNTLIQYTSDIDKFLSTESNKIFNLCCDYFDIAKDGLTIISYLHITTEKTRYSLPNFSQNKFHTDDDDVIAGIVYLTPNAPPHAGTSILDGEKNEFVNIENLYNRLICYEAHRIHGISDLFGDSDETGRMTFTFFIKPPPDEDSYLKN